MSSSLNCRGPWGTIFNGGGTLECEDSLLLFLMPDLGQNISNSINLLRILIEFCLLSDELMLTVFPTDFSCQAYTQSKVLNIPHNKLGCYSTLSLYGLWSCLPPLTAGYPGSAKGQQSLVQQCEPIPGKTSVWVQIKPVIQFSQWTSLLALLLKPVHTC